MSFFDGITADQTGLPAALEQYYEALSALVGERSGQPLLLNNSITTFDIDAAAPFYSEGVFRRFADRKCHASPMDLGSVAQSERFSSEYERVIEIAASGIDETLGHEQLQRIDNLKREIRRVTESLVEFEQRVSESWQEIVENENLQQGSPTYALRRLNYLETVLYADRKGGYTEEIASYQRNINKIREAAYTLEQQKLLRAADELADSYKIARPWTRSLERQIPDFNVLTLSDPRVRSKQLCDISPAIYPSNDLVEFQQRGGAGGEIAERSLAVSAETAHRELHTKTWGVRGSAGFRVFGIGVGLSGGASGASSYRRNFKDLKSFEISFAGIDEVYADRGLWFDPSLFSSDELKPLFDKIPGARDLEHVAVSLILCRGLTLKLNFESVLEEENWSRRTFRARGGISFFGFRFGGSGSSSRTTYDYRLSDDRKSVVFSDEATHCRLLAARLERIYHPTSADEPEARPLFAAGAVAGREGLSSGRLSLAEFQSRKLEGFAGEEKNLPRVSS